MSKLKKIKYLLWRFAHKLQLDIYPLDKRNSIQSYLSYIVRRNKIDSIWDIGANTGQYASMLRNIGYKGKIISVEPIPAAWEKLRLNACNDHMWIVHDRCALGLNEGLATMNVTADSVSSSLLRPNDIASVVNTVNVNVVRLESIISRIGTSNCNLLKLDCQGSEYEILLSAGGKISNFQYVQMEASIYPLYENEKTFHELSELMDSLGFDISYISPGITDLRDRMVQIELIYKKR